MHMYLQSFCMYTLKQSSSDGFLLNPDPQLSCCFKFLMYSRFINDQCLFFQTDFSRLNQEHVLIRLYAGSITCSPEVVTTSFYSAALSCMHTCLYGCLPDLTRDKMVKCFYFKVTF